MSERPHECVIIVGRVMLELSAEQIQAVENGEAVSVTVQRTPCVLIRADIYERAKAILEITEAYPLLDETFRDKARHNSRYVSSEFHRLTVVDSTLRELEELEKPEW
jgi:antitoxin (DNA-binding transcriptional repressor) of toxin-antitoxin stability system